MLWIYFYDVDVVECYVSGIARPSIDILYVVFLCFSCVAPSIVYWMLYLCFFRCFSTYYHYLYVDFYVFLRCSRSTIYIYMLYFYLWGKHCDFGNYDYIELCIWEVSFVYLRHFRARGTSYSRQNLLLMFLLTFFAGLHWRLLGTFDALGAMCFRFYRACCRCSGSSVVKCLYSRIYIYRQYYLVFSVSALVFGWGA